MPLSALKVSIQIDKHHLGTLQPLLPMRTGSVRFFVGVEFVSVRLFPRQLQGL